MKIYEIKIVGQATPRTKAGDSYEVERGTGILRVFYRIRVPESDEHIHKEVFTAAHGVWRWIDEVR